MERHAWSSPNTGTSMPVVRYGTAGPALVYVPSSGGDEGEFARYGMPGTCAPWLDTGRLQLYSIDGRARETFWNDALPPVERVRGYAAFERYVVEELLPWVREVSGDPRPGLVGASYGAHVVANMLYKHAEGVGIGCGLGGVYGLWHRLDGHHDDDVYFHTPLEYLPRLEDPKILDPIRAGRGLVLFAAGADEWLWSTERMVSVLRDKQLPHVIDVWPAPANHHEQWWRRQLESFLQRFW
jgi:esterase/lipase superfamily enzyme